MSTSPFLAKKPTPIVGPFILSFNGPPKCGKDTIASCLMDILDKGATSVPIHKQALAATMREGACAILGVSGGDKWYNEIKDQPLEMLGGDTFRRFMINLSERFVKDIYGQSFWGKLLHSRSISWWNKIPSILIITDLGFAAEAEYLIKHSTSFLNVRVDRPGTDFYSDSRGYVAASTYGGHDLVITNDGTVEEAAEQILKQMYRLGFPVL